MMSLVVAAPCRTSEVEEDESPLRFKAPSTFDCVLGEEIKSELGEWQANNAGGLLGERPGCEFTGLLQRTIESVCCSIRSSSRGESDVTDAKSSTSINSVLSDSGEDRKTRAVWRDAPETDELAGDSCAVCSDVSESERRSTQPLKVLLSGPSAAAVD